MRSFKAFHSSDQMCTENFNISCPGRAGIDSIFVSTSGIWHWTFDGSSQDAGIDGSFYHVCWQHFLILLQCLSFFQEFSKSNDSHLDYTIFVWFLAIEINSFHVGRQWRDSMILVGFTQFFWYTNVHSIHIVTKNLFPSASSGSLMTTCSLRERTCTLKLRWPQFSLSVSRRDEEIYFFAGFRTCRDDSFWKSTKMYVNMAHSSDDDNFFFFFFFILNRLEQLQV